MWCIVYFWLHRITYIIDIEIYKDKYHKNANNNLITIFVNIWSFSANTLYLYIRLL